MVIQTLVLSWIKKNLSKAAAKLISELTGDIIGQFIPPELKKIIDILEKFSDPKKIDNLDALFLNRIKSAPKAAIRKLKKYFEHEFGLDDKNLKRLLKLYKQTEKAAKQATGRNYADDLRKHGKSKKKKIEELEKELTESESPKSWDFDADPEPPKSGDFDADPEPEPKKNINREHVINLLSFIDYYLKSPEVVVNKYKKELELFVNFFEFFDENKNYSYKTVIILEDILSDLYQHLEYYEIGKGQEIAIVKENGIWNRFTLESYKNSILYIKQQVKSALLLPPEDEAEAEFEESKYAEKEKEAKNSENENEDNKREEIEDKMWKEGETQEFLDLTNEDNLQAFADLFR